MKKYMCGVTFQEELHCHDIRNYLYDSIEEVKKRTCWEACGIIELDLDDVGNPEQYNSFKWLHPQNLSKIHPGDYVDIGIENAD